jgi:hypothetical protein
LAIISGDESTPMTVAPGQRRASVPVSSPGPQPRSTTVPGFSTFTWAIRSKKGRDRSEPYR